MIKKEIPSSLNRDNIKEKNERINNDVFLIYDNKNDSQEYNTVSIIDFRNNCYIADVVEVKKDNDDFEEIDPWGNEILKQIYSHYNKIKRIGNIIYIKGKHNIVYDMNNGVIIDNVETEGSSTKLFLNKKIDDNTIEIYDGNISKFLKLTSIDLDYIQNDGWTPIKNYKRTIYKCEDNNKYYALNVNPYAVKTGKLSEDYFQYPTDFQYEIIQLSSKREDNFDIINLIRDRIDTTFIDDNEEEFNEHSKCICIREDGKVLVDETIHYDSFYSINNDTIATIISSIEEKMKDYYFISSIMNKEY